MPYAQTHYQEKVGNSNLTIAEIGCFVTADCNLLEDIGQEIAPDALNSFYTNKGIYAYDLTDKASDDITWGSVTRYNPSVVVAEVGGAGWPNSNFSIVKFYYQGSSGIMITHFCKVHDWAAKQIIDSYDGQVKTVGLGTYYGEPVAWAIFTHTTAVPVATLPYTQQNIDPKQVQLIKDAYRYNLTFPTVQAVTAGHEGISPKGTSFMAQAIIHHDDGYDYYMPNLTDPSGFLVNDCQDYVAPPYVPPAAPVPVTKPETYTLLTTVVYYSNAQDAVNDTNAKTTLPAGIYYVFAKNNGMLNLSTNNVKDMQQWINPAQNIEQAAPAVVVEPVPEPTPVPVEPVAVLKPSEVTIGTEADTAWQATYVSFHPDRSPDTYELLLDYTMQEYSGKRGPVTLSQDKRINICGKFEKNGIWFYRPRDYKNDVTFVWYYGIPLFDDEGKPTMKKILDETLPQHVGDLFRLWKNDLKNYLGDKPIWDVVFHKSKGVKK